MVQTLWYLSQSTSFTLKYVDIWRVLQTITLTHPPNFALVNIALNQLPGGQMVQILPMGLAPLAYIWAEVHRHQTAKRKP